MYNAAVVYNQSISYNRVTVRCWHMKPKLCIVKTFLNPKNTFRVLVGFKRLNAQNQRNPATERIAASSSHFRLASGYKQSKWNGGQNHLQYFALLSFPFFGEKHIYLNLHKSIAWKVQVWVILVHLFYPLRSRTGIFPSFVATFGWECKGLGSFAYIMCVLPPLCYFMCSICSHK